MIIRTLRWGAVLILAGLAVVSACTAKDADIETQDPAIAKQIVDQYAKATLTYSGQSQFSQSDIGSMPCEGRRGELSDTIYTMIGTYQLLVPASEQPALLNRVRDAWQAQGYTITAQRTYPSNGGGEVNATDPNDGVLFSLSLDPPMRFG
jgi:hypothetical protein